MWDMYDVGLTSERAVAWLVHFLVKGQPAQIAANCCDIYSSSFTFCADELKVLSTGAVSGYL